MIRIRPQPTNCRSALTRLGFTVRARDPQNDVPMEIGGKRYTVTAEEVRDVARNSNHEPNTEEFYVEVGGKKFPPKQLIELVLNRSA